MKPQHIFLLCVVLSLGCFAVGYVVGIGADKVPMIYQDSENHEVYVRGLETKTGPFGGIEYVVTVGESGKTTDYKIAVSYETWKDIKIYDYLKIVFINGAWRVYE